MMLRLTFKLAYFSNEGRMTVCVPHTTKKTLASVRPVHVQKMTLWVQCLVFLARERDTEESSEVGCIMLGQVISLYSSLMC